MDSGVSEQAVSHVRLTFPKRIFEVCHLIRRETETEFLGTDLAGEFTKQIKLSRLNDDHVTVSLAVDHLSFEDYNLCFYVDKVEPNDEVELVKCLELEVSKPTQTIAEQALSLQTGHSQVSGAESNSTTLLPHLVSDANAASSTLIEDNCGVPADQRIITVKKKRGRPRKEEALARKKAEEEANPDSACAESQADSKYRPIPTVIFSLVCNCNLGLVRSVVMVLSVTNNNSLHDSTWTKKETL